MVKTVAAFDRFWAVSHAVSKETDSFLKKLTGISAGKYSMLMVLYFNGGTMSSAKLAEGTGTRPHNITALVKSLKRDGLVKAEKGTKDTRFTFISLTDKSRKLMEDTLPASRKHAESVMADIKPEELAELYRMMDVIGNNIKGHKPE